MKITVVAFADCMTSAAFGLMDALNIAGALAVQAGHGAWSRHLVRIATAGGRKVEGFGGFPITPHCALEEVADSDVVLIPPILGPIEPVLAREATLVAWLARLDPARVLLGSACTGAFFLAETGRLDGRQVTTNPLHAPLFLARYPAVALDLDRRIAGDGGVICAGSTTAFIDLAIHVVDRLGGHELAVATAKALSVDRNPGEQRPYLLFIAPRDHGDRRVLDAQHWIESHHARPIGVADMAGQAGMSPRNFARRFQAATGHSPMGYLRLVRIETAKRLLDGGNAAVEQIAADVGYGDTRAFIRSFAGQAGLSPAEYRRFGRR